MSEAALDDVDRQILRVLQEDARGNTNAAISERVGVAPSTVGNRIRRLEADGVITGYRPEIDYDRTGLPMHVLFVCSTPIGERGDLAREVRDVRGVVSVTELMTGAENLLVEVVGANDAEITRLARAVGELGIDLDRQVLLKDRWCRPANVFDPQ